MLLPVVGAALLLALSSARAGALRGGAPSIPSGAVLAVAMILPLLAIPSFRARLRTVPRWRSSLLGAGLGVALLLPGAWLRGTGHHAAGELLPGGLLAAWAPAVCLVAAAEEAALRGAIQPWLRSAVGPAPAILLTATVFALMHYPLYGAAALPLDLGVGILIGCLREYTSSVSACALAHAIADLGAWWLP